ncbi:hypothetical protein J43TS9_40910 [Paenibacillus cineris]|nr:hypothetical protein J43TS9_40910 [Paenibacillus cineris]
MGSVLRLREWEPHPDPHPVTAGRLDTDRGLEEPIVDIFDIPAAGEEEKQA